MRVSDNLAKNNRGVSDIWEIRLNKVLIKRIRALAVRRKCTMSWIARYCIFRLVHKRVIDNDTFHEMVHEIKTTRPAFGELGRFYVCLYGDDILWIKMQSNRQKVTVSMLFRVALLRYLDSISNERAVPWWRLFWYGIKLNKEIIIQSQRWNRSLVQEFLNCKSYTLENYWKIPEGPLPGFLKQIS